MPVPAAGAAAAAAAGPRFRIRAAKNNFVYSLSRFRLNNNPVYKCVRGSGEHPDKLLWLFRVSSGHWVAVEARYDTNDPVADGAPVVRTVGDGIDDISAPTAALGWSWWNEEEATWLGNMALPTVTL